MQKNYFYAPLSHQKRGTEWLERKKKTLVNHFNVLFFFLVFHFYKKKKKRKIENL